MKFIGKSAQSWNNALISNPYWGQTSWPKWMKFWYKKRQYILFKTGSISNTWLLASVSKSLTESDNSAGWPGNCWRGYWATQVGWQRLYNWLPFWTKLGRINLFQSCFSNAKRLCGGLRGLLLLLLRVIAHLARILRGCGGSVFSCVSLLCKRGQGIPDDTSNWGWFLKVPPNVAPRIRGSQPVLHTGICRKR